MTRLAPTSHWPEGTPQPIPWQAVIDLQRHQSADENTVLEESIKHEGVHYPQILMPDGRIVDGHLRGQLATKLGVPLPLPLLLPEGTTDERGLNLARELQWGRRNLSLKDWREGRGAIEEFYLTLRRAGASQVEAARAAGIPRSTGAGLERRLIRRGGSKTAGQDGVRHNVDSNNVSSSEIADKRRKLSPKKATESAEALNRGETQKQVAERQGVNARTLQRRLHQTDSGVEPKPQPRVQQARGHLGGLKGRLRTGRSAATRAGGESTEDSDEDELQTPEGILALLTRFNHDIEDIDAGAGLSFTTRQVTQMELNAEVVIARLEGKVADIRDAHRGAEA